MTFTPLAPPIELNCSVFAKFQIRSSDLRLDVPSETQHKVATSMKQSSALFSDRTERFAHLSPFLEDILGVHLDTAGDTEHDRTAEHQVTIGGVPSTAYIMVEVGDNELGMGGFDVTAQAALSWQKLVLQVSSPSITIVDVAELSITFL